jgi:RHS repeat-associated protein
VVDNSGAVQKHEAYSAFGQTTIDSNPSVKENYGFSGGFTDGESGLINHWKRWASPATANWMSQDPIGFSGRDANLYSYVGNAPTTWTDPTGLMRLTMIKAAEPDFGETSWWVWILGGESASSREWVRREMIREERRQAEERLKGSDDLVGDGQCAGKQTKWLYNGGTSSSWDSLATGADTMKQGMVFVPGMMIWLASELYVKPEAEFLWWLGGRGWRLFQIGGKYILRRGEAEMTKEAFEKLLERWNWLKSLPGEEHHAISKKIWDQLQKHKKLKGCYQVKDPRFWTKGVDRASHNGFETWHREYENKVIEWLKTHEKATQEDFENWLRWLYENDPDLKPRFPGLL